MTRQEAIDTIKAASTIYVQPRLGCSERWVRVSKREAVYVLNGFEDSGEIDVDVDAYDNGEVYLS